MRFVLMMIFIYVYIRARPSKFIMISREATVGGKCEARKLRAVDSGRIPIVHGRECTITSMESIVFPQVCAGSGVGCTGRWTIRYLTRERNFRTPPMYREQNAKRLAHALEKFPLFRNVAIFEEQENVFM